MAEHTLGLRSKPARTIPGKRDNLATSQLAGKLLAPEGINFLGIPCVSKKLVSRGSRFMDTPHRECKLGVGPRLSCVRTKLRIAAGWLAC